MRISIDTKAKVDVGEFSREGKPRGSQAELDSVQTVLEWSRTMTWKGIGPVVHLLDKTYKKGVNIAKKTFKKIEETFIRGDRGDRLPQYCIRIQHRPV